MGQHEDQMPYSVEGFRQLAETSQGLLNFDMPFKKVEHDYVIYRNNGWEAAERLKTALLLPGTAYINFNSVNADIVYPGLLSFLPHDHQIIVPLFPNAPEHKFPSQLIHLQHTVPQILKKCKEYRIDESSVVVGGYSCGGTLAVPLGIHLVKQNLRFRSLLYISPIFDYSGESTQRPELKKWEKYELQDNKTLGPKFIDFMNQNCSRTPSDLRDRRYSPLFTPLQDLSLLKQSSFIYGEFDFMRRSIEAFKGRLTAAGVQHETEIVKGEGHRLMIMMKSKTTILDPEKEELLRKSKLEAVRRIASCLKRIMK